MKRVFITRRLPSIAAAILRERFAVDENAVNEPCAADKLAAAVADYDAILSTVSEKLDKGILQQRKKLLVISNYAVGLDNIDLAYARANGVAVYNTPDVVTNSSADLTLALLLTLVRKIPYAQEYVRQGRWKEWDPERCLGEELSGKVFGILGFGRIGRAVARRAAGFGMDILYYSRQAKHDATSTQYTRVASLEELLGAADYLSVHIPLTDTTRNLINCEMFDKMHKRPVLLNMARGEVVVTDDLVEALRAGKIRGAGLDVVTAECLSRDHPLCQADNVVVVPHIGTATQECRRNMAALAAQNIVKHFQ